MTTTTKTATAGDDHAEEEANEREIRRIRQAALKRLATAGVFSARPPGLRDSDGHTFRDETPIDGLCDDCGSSAQFHAEQSSNPDAERIAQLENEGLTHSDAVGAMEAEKLARQPEPATGEERRWQMSSPMVNHMVATDLKTSDHKPIGIDMEDDQNMHYAAVQVFAGEDVAREVFRAVNSHTQLVAALESELEALRVWQKARDFDLEDVRAGFRISIDKIQRALRLAKDGE
jgi:hypothetical protein